MNALFVVRISKLSITLNNVSVVCYFRKRRTALPWAASRGGWDFTQETSWSRAVNDI